MELSNVLNHKSIWNYIQQKFIFSIAMAIFSIAMAIFSITMAIFRAELTGISLH